MNANKHAQEKLGMAQILANAAFKLDEQKLLWPDMDGARLLNAAEQIYDVAEYLAGSKKEEIYSAPPLLEAALLKMCRINDELTTSLYALLDAHDAGDMAGVELKLKRMSAFRKQGGH